MSDITLDKYIILGTAADRALFTPDPGPAADGTWLLPVWIESDTGDAYYWDNTGTPAWVAWPVTGALTAADIGVTVQAYNANLTTFAGIAPSANVQTILGAANYSAIRTALTLVPGTDVQAYDAQLADLAGITFAQGDVLYFNGTNLVKLAAGTSGHFLKTLGAGANPTWAAATGTLADGDYGDVTVGGTGTTMTIDADAVTVAKTSGIIVPPQGRLTLTSNTPVMNADATAQGTVYYAPHVGSLVPIYSGSLWNLKTFAQLTLSLNSTDNLANSLYDIFVFNNAGTITLGTGPAWINSATITVTIATPGVVTWTAHGLNEGSPVTFTTTGALPTGITAGTTYFVSKTGLTANAFSISTTLANSAAGTNVATSGSQSGTHTGTNGTTIRGTGAGTTELELKDGIWTNKNTVALKGGGSTIASPTANKATYLGTIYCTGNGQTGMAFNPAVAAGGSAPILGVWNAYNRVPTTANMISSTGAYTPASGIAMIGPTVGNRITYVDGLAQSSIDCLTLVKARCSAGSFVIVYANRNNTTTIQAFNCASSESTSHTAMPSRQALPPVLGLNYMQGMINAGSASAQAVPDSGGMTLALAM